MVMSPVLRRVFVEQDERVADDRGRPGERDVLVGEEGCRPRHVGPAPGHPEETQPVREVAQLTTERVVLVHAVVVVVCIDLRKSEHASGSFSRGKYVQGAEKSFLHIVSSYASKCDCGISPHPVLCQTCHCYQEVTSTSGFMVCVMSDYSSNKDIFIPTVLLNKLYQINPLP